MRLVNPAFIKASRVPKALAATFPAIKPKVTFARITPAKIANGLNFVKALVTNANVVAIP